MIKKLLAFAPILFGCASTKPINTLPMYGGISKSQELINADNDFLKTVDAKGQTRDSSSRYFSNIGWQFFYQGKDDVAIKRFNQAWLLNPKNADVYFGFGSITGRRRTSIDSTIMFLKMANALDNENILITASLAYAFSSKAYQLKLKSDSKWQTYKDSSLASYGLFLSKIRPESDQGLQYLESLVMLNEKNKAKIAITEIDTSKLVPRQLPRYHFIVSQFEKLQ